MTFYSHKMCSGMEQISSQNKVKVVETLNALTISRIEQNRKEKKKYTYQQNARTRESDWHALALCMKPE